MAPTDSTTLVAKCSLCFFYQSSIGRQSECRKCKIKKDFVHSYSPICNTFLLHRTVWCPKKGHLIPLASCLNKQDEMRRNVEDRKWLWGRCINCIQGVLFYKLDEMTREHILRLLRRTA